MRALNVPAALCLLGSSTIFAADDTAQLETLVVTATRGAQTADQALAAVTVLTREDIERSQAQSIQDLLRGLPGLSISNNGGEGKATSVFLRGTESDHVLVLVDGIPLGSATLGTTSFQDLPLQQIERIEIVRGPRSSLYGSQAIGGVIQIFTRRGGGGTRAAYSLGGGSYGTSNAAAELAGGGDHAFYAGSLSTTDTDGFNACRASFSAGCFTDEPDADGYRNLSRSLHAGYRFTNGLEADGRWLRAEAESAYDGGFVNETDSLQDALSLHVRLPQFGPWRARLDAGRSRDESENFKDGVFSSRFDTQKDSISVLNDFALAADHLLTIGEDYQDDQVDGTTTYDVSSRNNVGTFAQYQGAIAGQDVQLSLRSDDNEQFGRHTTGGLAWGTGFAGSLRAMAAYGTAFKAPTFNELYYPDFGNPNIKPETSRSYELGLSGAYGWGDWSVNAFQNDVDDLIGFDASFTPANIDLARIRGIETSVGTQYAGVNLKTHFTWMDPENRSDGANRGKVLPRRARQAARLDLDRAFGPFRFGTTLHGEGKRYDNLSNTRPLAGYATVDLRGEYAFARDWLVQLRGVNLLDKDYQTAAFYNQPGASAYLTLRYRLGATGG